MKVFVRFSAVDHANALRRATAGENPAELSQLRARESAAHEELRAWANAAGHAGVLSHGDGEGLLEVPAHKLAELDDVRQRYGQTLGSRVACGVGMRMGEADVALRAAVKRGGDRITLHTKDLQRELAHEKDAEAQDPLSRIIANEAKAQEGAAMEKAEAMNTGPGAGFSGAAEGPANAAPAAPTEGTADHSEAQALGSLITDPERPPPPEATHAAQDFENQFHSAASAQAQQDQVATQQKGADVDALRAQVGQVLEQVRGQGQVLAQLKQGAPQTFQAVMALVQSVIAMGHALAPPQPEQAVQSSSAPVAKSMAEEVAEIEEAKLAKSDPWHIPKDPAEQLRSDGDPHSLATGQLVTIRHRVPPDENNPGWSKREGPGRITQLHHDEQGIYAATVRDESDPDGKEHVMVRHEAHDPIIWDPQTHEDTGQRVPHTWEAAFFEERHVARLKARGEMPPTHEDLAAGAKALEANLRKWKKHNIKYREQYHTGNLPQVASQERYALRAERDAIPVWFSNIEMVHRPYRMPGEPDPETESSPVQLQPDHAQLHKADPLPPGSATAADVPNEAVGRHMGDPNFLRVGNRVTLHPYGAPPRPGRITDLDSHTPGTQAGGQVLYAEAQDETTGAVSGFRFGRPTRPDDSTPVLDPHGTGYVWREVSNACEDVRSANTKRYNLKGPTQPCPGESCGWCGGTGQLAVITGGRMTHEPFEGGSPMPADDVDPVAKAALSATKTGRHDVVLPVGSVKEGGSGIHGEAGKIKVQHGDGKTGWVQAQAGQVTAVGDTHAKPILGAVSHPVSSRNPHGH